MFFFSLVCSSIQEWAEGIVQRELLLKPSDRAALASPSFLREDAGKVKEQLCERLSDCRFLGAPLLASVQEQNGWLLFALRSEAFDAYACTLPEQLSCGEDILERRMELLLRQPDGPLPNEPGILSLLVRASYACSTQSWNEALSRQLLTMTHAYTGMERVQIEHALHRAAKIIIYERRNGI